MSKNYEMINLISSQCTDPMVSTICTRLYNRLDKQKIYASALSTSIEMVIALRLHGIKANLILGTIGLPVTKECFPSAWVEIDDKIYDLAIYFDSSRHPMLKEHTTVIKPQINRDYATADVDYFDFQFPDIFEMSDMIRHIDHTAKEFCDNSPYGDDLWCDILYAADILQTSENLKKAQNIGEKIIIKRQREEVK